MTRKIDEIVTDEHIARYRHEGCVRVERVFDSATCTNLAAALNEALRAFDAGTLQRAADASSHQNPPTVHRGEGQVQLRNFAQHLPILRDWLAKIGVDASQAAYMGNDVNDVECLRHCGLAVVPSDSHATAIAVADLVLTKPGGRGAIREFADALIAARGGSVR